MVHLIKLPFVIDPTYLPDIPDPIPVSIEEVDSLKETIVRLEKDKESLEHSLYDTTYKNNQVSYDLEQRDKQLLENREELQAERSKRQKTLGGLFSTEVEFKNINKKLKETQAKGQRWKRSWDLDVWEQQERTEAWRIEHSNMADFANNLVRDVPRMYKRVDSVANFRNTPQEVFEFIRLCDV
ncbi:hypothetical protein KIW84_035675 [Lathyrus oleraceus]|uniref:Uncharacterized protein n=1 Tax=Pisum sativum TaxID=3888 RepID=A0A9D4Y2R9_PEA|nr:hypothetical protein KIW84_035675 [Pisum sativum]